MTEIQIRIFFIDFFGIFFTRNRQIMRLTLLFWLIVSSFNVVYGFQNDLDIRINKVTIQGNEAYPEIVLKEVIKSEGVSFYKKLTFWKRQGEPFIEDEIRRDVIRLQRFYQRRGFPEVRVTYEVNEREKDWQRDIIIIITEGPFFRINSLVCEFTSDTVDKEKILNHNLFERSLNKLHYREDARYEPILEDEVISEIQNTLKNMGYAFSQTSIQTRVDSTNYQVDLVILLDQGPRTTIGKFTVEGNETVSEEQVIRESALRVGQQFDQRSINRAQREIFSHHLFRFVTITLPEQPRDSTVELFVRVRENPLRSVSVLAGVGTEEILRGSVSWMHRNPFGNAHNLGITARASFIEQRFSADYLMPYVFNTRSSYVLSPFAQRIDERNFFVTRLGIVNSFIYQYSEDLASTISYEFTTNQEAFDSEQKLFRDSTETYQQSTIKISGYFNPSFLRQEAGWAFRPYLEISGPFGTGSLTYNRVGLDMRRFVDIGTATQVALRANTNLIFGDEDEQLPASLLNYIGGTNSVRGWGRWNLGPKRAVFEDDGSFWRYVPVGGRYLVSMNAEIRQNLDFIYSGFGIAIFLDAGQIWQKLDHIHYDDLQYGGGFGFRYRSPIGPIRLDFGYKINPTNEDLAIYNGVDYGGKMQRIGIHFNIGQAF